MKPPYAAKRPGPYLAPGPGRTNTATRRRERSRRGSTAPQLLAAATLAGLALAMTVASNSVAAEATATTNAHAVLAGGCFWCMEPPFDALDGVLQTTSGYTGGSLKDPTYKQVSGGGTGHTEALRIDYDPAKISYEELLAVFWRNIDPTDGTGQFCDKGSQYRSEIFFGNDAEREAAETAKSELEESGKLSGAIATEITQASTFYPAEEYHQDYYLKNPIRYKFYRHGCGRDKRLSELWGETAASH